MTITGDEECLESLKDAMRLNVFAHLRIASMPNPNESERAKIRDEAARRLNLLHIMMDKLSLSVPYIPVNTFEGLQYMVVRFMDSNEYALSNVNADAEFDAAEEIVLIYALRNAALAYLVAAKKLTAMDSVRAAITKLVLVGDAALNLYDRPEFSDNLREELMKVFVDVDNDAAELGAEYDQISGALDQLRGDYC